MKLKDLLTMLRREKRQRLLVTGPAGSGTGIGAYILALELKSIFIHQRTFSYNDYQKFIHNVNTLKNYVCQAPCLVPCLSNVPDDVLIVAMVRPLGDILTGRREYPLKLQSEQRRFYANEKIFDMSHPLPHIEYEFIERVVSRTRRVEYLEYESMVGHDFFVPHIDRAGFKPEQLVANKKRINNKVDFSKRKGG